MQIHTEIEGIPSPTLKSQRNETWWFWSFGYFQNWLVWSGFRPGVSIFSCTYKFQGCGNFDVNVLSNFVCIIFTGTDGYFSVTKYSVTYIIK